MHRSQVTKHAQLGTDLTDHSILEHSGFGPYCNPCAMEAFGPEVGVSLLYWINVLGRDGPAWFERRADALKAFIRLWDQRSPQAGFCVCCSYTQCDMLFNAIYNLEFFDPPPTGFEGYFRCERRMGSWFKPST